MAGSAWSRSQDAGPGTGVEPEGFPRFPQGLEPDDGFDVEPPVGAPLPLAVHPVPLARAQEGEESYASPFRRGTADFGGT